VPIHHTYYLCLKTVSTINYVLKASYLIYVVPYNKVHLSAKHPPSFLLNLGPVHSIRFFCLHCNSYLKFNFIFIFFHFGITYYTLHWARYVYKHHIDRTHKNLKSRVIMRYPSRTCSQDYIHILLLGDQGGGQDTYRGADNSLARPGRKQATATADFDFHISYL
jgi:hypothetical protein